MIGAASILFLIAALAEPLNQTVSTQPSVEYSRGEVDVTVVDAAMLMSESQGGNLPIAVKISPADPQRILLAIEIEVPTTSATHELDIVVYVISQHRTVLHHQSFRGLRVPDDVTHRLTAVAIFDTPPPTTSVRVLVRDQNGRSFGLAGLRVGKPPDMWVVAERQSTDRFALFESAASAGVDLLDTVPTSQRTFALGDTIRLARILDPIANAALDKACSRCHTMQSCRPFDSVRALCTWDLSTADRELSLMTSDHELAIVIEAPQPSQPQADIAGITEPQRSTRDSRRRQLVEVLAGLGERSQPQAINDLIAFDRTLASELARSPSGSPEMQLVSSFDQRRSGDFLPLALLRWQVSKWYRENGSSVLAERSMRSAANLASHVIRTDQRKDERRQAALMLTEIAGSLFATGRSPEADVLLERATSPPNGDPRVLLAAAINAEQMGAHAQTIERLQRLLAIDSTHAEAKLRLAINLARSGTLQTSTQLFEELAQTPATPTWIAIIATEELILGALRSDHLKRAHELVNGRFVDHPSMVLLSDYLTAMDPASSCENPLPPALSDDAGPRAIPQIRYSTIAPRSRYRQWPFTVLDEKRLERSVDAKRAALKELVLGR